MRPPFRSDILHADCMARIRSFCWWACMLSLLLPGGVGCTTFGGGATSYEDVRTEVERERAVRQVSYVDDEYYEEEDRIPREKGVTTESFAPENVANSVQQSYRNLTGRGRSPKVARELYAKAEVIYQAAAKEKEAGSKQAQAKFVEAAEVYLSAALRWPDSALEQDAIFMAGESFFFADYYFKANHQYERVVEAYPSGKHLDTIEARKFLIAQYWEEYDAKKPQPFYSFNFFDESRPRRDEFGYALRVYDKIRLDDPTGKLADDATMAAGVAAFKKADYFKADNYFADLRDSFPRSEHQFMAHYLGVRSKIESYTGPSYAGDALVEAATLLERMRTQFPTQFQEKREELTKIDARIRYLRAEREWAMGQYYENLARYGGAKFYYEIILSDFPGTPYASQARERLTALQGKADAPTDKYEWLSEMLPKSDSERIADLEPDGEGFQR